MSKLWHKGSRYWKWGIPLVVFVDLIGLGVIVWRQEFAGAAIGMIGSVTTAFLVGAGAKTAVGEYNKPAFQRDRPFPEGKDD